MTTLAHIEATADDSGKGIIACGQPIVVHGDAALGPLVIPCDGTIAGQVWGAGAALGHSLIGKTLPARPEVVEIGSGTGVAGLAAAIAGAARVVLTDMPTCVGRLQQAIERNKEVLSGSEVLAAPLEWGDAEAALAVAPEGVDLVIAADVLYSGEPAVHEALRASMVALGKARDASILHAYEERWPQIVSMWRDGMEAGGLRLVRESVLDAPWIVPDGAYSGFRERRLILEEIRLTDEALYS